MALFNFLTKLRKEINVNLKELSTTEEFVKTVFLKETLQVVKSQFVSNVEISPIDSFGMNFRLLRATPKTINLELLSRGILGTYFIPIAVYNNDSNIALVMEFEKDFKSIENTGHLPTGAKYNKFSLLENAIIAAFSMGTFEKVFAITNDFKNNGFETKWIQEGRIPDNNRYDKRYQENDFVCDLFMAMEGYPQFYLDDRYGINGPLAGYPPNQKNNFHANPMVQHKALFDKMLELKLLSGYKTI